MSDISVYIPTESRLEKAIISNETRGRSKILATGWRFYPPLRKRYIELPAPTVSDNTSDLSRLLRELKKQHNLSNMWVDFEVVKKLPEALRKGDWKITVTTLVTAVKTKTGDKHRPRLINVEPGDTRNKHFALAIDVGTTTVCGQILDLNRGRVLAEHLVFNKQISYGADVISRINYSQKTGALKKLQKAVVDSINEVIERLLEQSRVDIKHVGHMTAAGNTVMTHLLLGLDTRYIRLAPYVPVANLVPPIEARSLGIKVQKEVYLFTFPSVASYVGGDIVSGVLAAGIHQRKELTFFIDIGTNGEIVVGNSSTSAGPAFEGGGIRFGMIATKGAIDNFSINPSNLEPEIKTIGGAKPRGICGSGLINITAGLLENGVIGQNGKFHADLSFKRIREGEDGFEYVLTWARETDIGKDIVITEVDIDNLIRAKAAIYAGCQTLSKSVGVSCADFEKVILAGNFGSSLNIEKAITIGLLPDIPRERFTYIGNGSLMGARLTSFSTDILDDARRVARMMTNFELSENTDFMDNYVASLFLPHTSAHAFPTVTQKIERLQKRTVKGAQSS
ncbi:ASKHA domain-containing protein [Chloroflexota bacterium]